ncbi:hypothetical protein HT574_16660 [Parageobacillus sp. VR-IP]|uniref:hypothetical protein n=1 Tax=Parageobacillus sp. VR-IP TaxID=2742205 RepID=UPI0015824892|nr:hypothetical protein [Parageobacillus sp. VR-IP]NUK31650.1 hypothetical protein [Parageobacillus sp. VR-IP]
MEIEKIERKEEERQARIIVSSTLMIEQAARRIGPCSFLCGCEKPVLPKLMTENIYDKMKKNKLFDYERTSSIKRGEEVHLFDYFFRSAVGIIENHCD